MEFSRQEYWSGLLCPSPGDIPYPRREWALCLLHWQADSLPLVPSGKAYFGIPGELNHWLRAACGRRGLGTNLGMTHRDPHLGPFLITLPVTDDLRSLFSWWTHTISEETYHCKYILGWSLVPGEFQRQRSLVSYSPWGCRVKCY